MTELNARAEVVGYEPVVLEAIRDLVREIEADPELASTSGHMIDAMSEVVVVDRGRRSQLMGAMAHLITAAAEVALQKGSDHG